MSRYTHKAVNGRRVPLTAAEIREFEANEAAHVPEPPRPVLTPEQKLARIGLTVAELRSLLAGS